MNQPTRTAKSPIISPPMIEKLPASIDGVFSAASFSPSTANSSMNS